MISIYFLSRHKTSFLDPGFQYYEKAINQLHPLNMQRFKEERKLQDALRKQRGMVVACSRKGRELSNDAWLKVVKEALEIPPHQLTLVVGGSEGLEEKTRKLCTDIFSFSRLTIAHEIFRLVLMEQVYRALTRMHGLRYHKGQPEGGQHER